MFFRWKVEVTINKQLVLGTSPAIGGVMSVSLRGEVEKKTRCGVKEMEVLASLAGRVPVQQTLLCTVPPDRGQGILRI